MKPEKQSHSSVEVFKPGQDLRYASGGSRRFVVIDHDVARRRVLVVTHWEGGLRKYEMDQDYFTPSRTQSPIINQQAVAYL